MNSWFDIDSLDADTYVLSELSHWEETRCYLLCGAERALLIDTGLGVRDISLETARLTDKPVLAALTHAHWDHIGGCRQFPFCVHSAERAWLEDAFPLPDAAVRKMLAADCALPPDFDVNSFTVFHGAPARILHDGDTLDLGGRTLEVLHTPGHSPGHVCFFEHARGFLFTGDLVYKGTLYADYPSTDPQAYLRSLERIAALPVKRVLPGHHALDAAPALIAQMRDALRTLDRAGTLRHGAGTFDFGEWRIQM